MIWVITSQGVGEDTSTPIIAFDEYDKAQTWLGANPSSEIVTYDWFAIELE